MCLWYIRITLYKDIRISTQGDRIKETLIILFHCIIFFFPCTLNLQIWCLLEIYGFNFNEANIYTVTINMSSVILLSSEFYIFMFYSRLYGMQGRKVINKLYRFRFTWNNIESSSFLKSFLKQGWSVIVICSASRFPGCIAFLGHLVRLSGGSALRQAVRDGGDTEDASHFPLAECWLLHPLQ